MIPIHFGKIDLVELTLLWAVLPDYQDSRSLGSLQDVNFQYLWISTLVI